MNRRNKETMEIFLNKSILKCILPVYTRKYFPYTFSKTIPTLIDSEIFLLQT